MKRIKFLSIHLTIAALPGVAAAIGPDHSKWDALVKRYVNTEARVDYRSLKANGLAELDAYLSEMAAPWPSGMEPQATKAALINSYNALTVRWILSNYPVESIEQTKDPFTAERHTLSGSLISLDKIEGRLRAMGDPRIHAVLVCAARSCPPLRREAYAAARIEEQLDDNVRTWLANRKLNEFIPAQSLARVSSIFKWYSGDFESAGGLKPFLARFAPASTAGFLREPNAKIEFQTYNWGLNDAADLGSGYSEKDFYLDIVRGGLRNPWTSGTIFVFILTGVLLILRRRGARL
jgi:Protein of unknown function, DUF547